MCDQACASIPDGVHANAFGFTAALKISDYFKGVDNVCQINLGSQGFWTPDELHGAILYFLPAVHYILNQVFRYFRCLAECCDAVLL